MSDTHANWCNKDLIGSIFKCSQCIYWNINCINYWNRFRCLIDWWLCLEYTVNWLAFQRFCFDILISAIISIQILIFIYPSITVNTYIKWNKLCIQHRISIKWCTQVSVHHMQCVDLIHSIELLPRLNSRTNSKTERITHGFLVLRLTIIIRALAL
jgi:hypothetical protein